MFDVSLGLIIKDDARVIREWLAYHTVIGVQHFWIACNDEDPSEFYAAVQPFAIRGLLHMFHMPGPRMQLPAYSRILNKARGRTKWLGFIDSDEFIHLRDSDDLPPFLRQYDRDDVAGLAVGWRIFGSNGHKVLQPSTMQAYTRRAHDNFVENEHLKVLVRPDRVDDMASPHHAGLRDGFRLVDERLNSVPGDVAAYNVPADRVRINHYYCRSEEDHARKMKRGRADSDDIAHRRTWEFYSQLDRNEVADEEILRHVPKVRATLEKICGQSL
jgi:hypothetical protein